MRTCVLSAFLSLTVLLSPALAGPAEDAKELAQLRAEKKVMDEKFKALLDRLDKIESELSRMRLQMSRDFTEVDEQLARIAGSGSTRIATGPTTPSTPGNTGVDTGNSRLFPDTPRNPINTTTTPATPTTPGTTTPRTNPGTTTPSNPINTTPTTPTITRPPITPENTGTPTTPGSIGTTARVDLPRIPDPFLPPTTPKRPRTDRAKGTPTTVAVVDMLALFNGLKEKTAIEESLTDLVYAVKFEDQKWRIRINEHELDLKLLTENTSAFIEKRRLVEQARIDWNVALAAAKSRLDRRRGELLKIVYAKMVDATGRVADQNGYDMVLFKESTPAYEAFANVGELVTGRMVIKAAESVDLTEQVLRVLNNEFDRQPRADAR